MIVATLRSKPLYGVGTGGEEIGEYSLDVKLHEGELRAAANPRKLLMHTIGIYLTSVVQDTSVPANMWLVNFPPKIQSTFSLPPILDMEITNDLSRLALH